MVHYLRHSHIFGGKANACELVWQLIGDPENYVEPFSGSAAMLLGRPHEPRVETINDWDCMVANFWRAISCSPDEVAQWADWPTNECDLFARHSWLVRQKDELRAAMHDPEFFDAKIAGWWCFGACNWIGSGWCSGSGPWVWDEEAGMIVDSRKLPHLSSGRGINRKLPHLSSGMGINRKLPHLSSGMGINRNLPHLSSGRGINRKLPHLGNAGRALNRKTDMPRGQFIAEWFNLLHDRLRDVRICCGDWRRVLEPSVTTRHGMTGVFLDPPYEKGEMDYGDGGMGRGISAAVREWCINNGPDRLLRIVVCGHDGEHDELLEYGWIKHHWKARKGYAVTDEAVENSASETVWASPHCAAVVSNQVSIFDILEQS